MIITKQHQLGLIPDWQYSNDPRVNINLNPHVKYPPGRAQTTPQPVNYDPNWTAPVNYVAPPGLHGTVFESVNAWAWTYRKPLTIAGLALLGLGLYAALKG